MKKLLMALCITCALSLVIHADDAKENKDAKKKAAPTAEQKAARKALVGKYDANKDGKLDKEERAKISAEEQEKAGVARKGEGKKKKKNQ